jgi:hypothetical protein
MLIGGKPATADNAFPASPNDISVFAQSGINHLVVNFSAKWALHEFLPAVILFFLSYPDL